jgi:Sulfotransferase family
VTWDPGPRPAWVQHAIDGQVGPALEYARRPLVAEELIAEAELRTGLDDFGPDDFRMPLDVFIDAIETEARLHVAGRARVREDLLHGLSNRLRMYAYLDREPSVREEPITAPVIVTGSPRAGTSIMHELIALLPGTRAPLSWEYFWPTPLPRGARGSFDPRIPLANEDLRLSAALAPQFDGIHEQGALVLREDGAAMVPSFRADRLWAHFPVPSYLAWLLQQSQQPAYEYHRMVLRVLQRAGDPTRTWVCKAPGHLPYLELILELYPDARIVVCHRDPLAMISSVTSLLGTLRWAHSEHVDYQGLARENMDQFGRNLDAVLDLRRRGVLTDNRCVDVRFDEFVADQAGTVSRIADHFGLPFTDDTATALKAHLDAKPRGRHGGHAHSVDDLGLDVATERRRFADYMDYFAIRPEEAR